MPNTIKLIELTSAHNKTRIHISGVLQEVRPIFTKSGVGMAFGILYDCSACIELVIFNEVYAKTKQLLTVGTFLEISGTLEGNQLSDFKFLCDTILPVKDPLDLDDYDRMIFKS